MNPYIYKYLDYRQYLADVFISRKKIIKSFSYRSFARMADSTSPNFLQLIQSRKLGISLKQIDAMAKSLGLKMEERTYFKTIVAFDHGKTHRDKDLAFQQILLTRESQSVKIIEKKQYDYFSRWYNPVVRELVTTKGYNGDPEWIANRIIPKISVAKVKKSIKLLKELKLIIADDCGKMLLVDKSISTPSEVIAMAVVRYHKDMITLGKESIERFAPADRDIRAVTLGLSKAGTVRLKQRMEAFWKEILAFAENEDDGEHIMQLNMQLFPISVEKESKK